MARKDHSTYIKEVAEARGKEIKVVGQYNGYNRKIAHRCVKHSITWEVTPNNIMYGQGCPECALEARRRKRKPETSQNEYEALVKKTHGKVLEVVGDYIDGKNAKFLHRCTKCGREWETTARRVLLGHGCASCNSSKLVSEAEYRRRLKADQYKSVKLLSFRTGAAIRSNGAGKKSVFECRACSNKWETSVQSILAGYGCPACAPTKGGNSSQYKEIVIKGKVFYVQGYEGKAIEWLLDNYNLKPSDIHTYSSRKVPFITWKDEATGKRRYHFPDIFVPKLNKIFEVKGLATIGFTKYKRLTRTTMFNSVKRKSIKAKAQGFKYEVMLMADQVGSVRIPLPKNWEALSAKEFRVYLKNNHEHLL